MNFFFQSTRSYLLICSSFLTLAILVENAMVQSAFVPLRPTLDPTRELEISSCRENCGDAFFECALLSCNEDDSTCQQMCKDHFRSCFHVCKTIPTAAPIVVVPPDAFLLRHHIN